MENQKKVLTRIQLVNWHYFENERISFNGSALVSGENTAGKSTILDAIQLVLTTNSRKFNMAANEKSNRDLKGYVRCKIGKIGENYLRKNVVPGNVALEFYEENGERYFVIGVHLLSQDEESPVKKSWYVVDNCRLEDLSFIIDDKRPALQEEFRYRGKKLRFIDTDRAAKDYFKRRLGNLDDKFFDIIPKSLAFKPMDNVKEFINKFVLSEAKIDIAVLRENIETLSELELLLDRSKKQYDMLGEIVELHEAILSKEKDIEVNDILLDIAQKDALQHIIDTEKRSILLKEQSAASTREEMERLEVLLQEIQQQIIGIQVAINSNSSNQIIETLKHQLEENIRIISSEKEAEKRLWEQAENLREYGRVLRELGYTPINTEEWNLLLQNVEQKQKDPILSKIQQFQNRELDEIRSKKARLDHETEDLTSKINELQDHLQNLEKRILKYPEHTTRLKELIEAEFLRKHITSKVYILSELLEVTDPEWQNAVEGYFDKQKFYLIVEPEVYNIALSVYEKSQDKVHSAGIINTRKLPISDQADSKSLAYVVHSNNRYAKAYANYLLGRVVRCQKVEELEQYDIAITSSCMLYQGYVVRKIDPRRYENPYIGQNAYRVQIVNTKKLLEEKIAARSQLRNQSVLFSHVLEQEKRFSLEIMRINSGAPRKLAEAKARASKIQAELHDAEKDPTLIELQLQLNQKEEEHLKCRTEEKRLQREESTLQNQIEISKNEVKQNEDGLENLIRQLQQKEDANGIAYKEAFTKYKTNRKKNSAKQIADNFQPWKARYENEREKLLDQLKNKQFSYNTSFTEDFIVGLSGMSEYRVQRDKLRTVEMIQYEEKLRSAKEDCENIFRSDFLSKMKELIENARTEFRNLNKALDHIYYGEDSYHFNISHDKGKEGLYRMITSENNQEGMNLWTQTFEQEYHDEMQELFDKLMTKDDQGKRIVEEYTDYRSYLDYDIEIRKRDGSVQRFSDIYGEKSGSETQVPYYVAIAASFYQLYRFGNSVRLILLDEAFDKMDDERIGSMMDFFNGLDLQVILATPPAKIEVIGEKVGTILTAIRVGQNSIVEEYDL